MRTQARFWLWENGGWVRIKIKAGQTLHWSRSQATDEGWSGVGLRLEFDGEIVRRECVNDGRDCDGRLTEVSEAECPVHLLAAWRADDGVMCPEWSDIGGSRYDEYAQAANY
jgi:hypothetical protein